MSLIESPDFAKIETETGLVTADALRRIWTLLADTDQRVTALRNQLGTWIDIPYRSGDFTGGGSQTWTVDAADLLANRYIRVGGLLIWEFAVTASDVGGTPNPVLRVANPLGLKHTLTVRVPLLRYTDAGGTLSAGWVLATADAATTDMFKSDSSNWTGTTSDNTIVAFIGVFPVKT